MKSEEISEKIFYSPATNGRAESSIHQGSVMIKDFAEAYHAEQSKKDDEFQLRRLYDWLTSENREPAKTKFTAGMLRNVANEIEFELKQEQ